MRIVIDMQGAQTGSRLRGIGRYSLALATAMVRNRREHEVLICISGLFPDSVESVRAAFAGLVPDENIVMWTAVSAVCSIDRANDWRRASAEILREEFLASLNADVVYISSLVEGFHEDAVHSVGRFDRQTLAAATFYDVIPLIQREIYLDPNPGLLAAYSEKVDHLKRTDMLLAISESARGEAIQYLGRSPDSVVNIGTAVDDQFKVVEIDAAARAALARKFGFRDGYVMYSGATDERKNHLRLIEAFSLLPKRLRSQFPLLIVGGMPPEHSERFGAHARSFGLTQDEFVITGRVTDDDLVALYNLCSLFVLPSWHEGFGLPALEAMSCGAPVIGSNTTSVPEVIGRDDALFDPHSVQAIRQKMMQVLDDESMRRDLAAHGLRQAKNFSWDRSANLTLDALERIVALRGPLPAGVHHKDPARRVASLAAKIASLPPAGRTDHDLLALAAAMSFNLASTLGRTLLVDVSAEEPRRERSLLNLLDELIRTAPPSMTVIPIRFEDRYFRRAVADRDSAWSTSRDIVDFRPNDVYLSFGISSAMAEVAHDLLMRMRRLGTAVYFAIPDSGLHTPAGASGLANAVKVCSGLLCFSSATELEIKRWMADNPPRRSDLPMVRNLGAGSSSAADTPNRTIESGTASSAASLLVAVGWGAVARP